MNWTWLYVALLYAAAVWIARRCGSDLPWRIAALFYVLVLLFLWAPMTGPFVDVPVDFLGGLPPWAFVHPSKSANSVLNDVTLQMLPWAHQVREQWRSLHVPLWNPQAGCGYPLLANGQSAALSPLRLLALPLTLGQSFTAEAAMKLLIAMTFTFLFCRRRGYSQLAGALGAVAFGFCTFIVVWLHFPHATVAAYLPAVLLHVDALADRTTLKTVFLGALLWAAVIFGGHPETAAHIFFLALLMAIWIVAVERRLSWHDGRRVLLAFVASTLLAGLIAAPFLVPFGEAIRKSQRFQQLQMRPSEVGFTDFQSSILLMQPRFFGTPPSEKPWGPAVAESIDGFAGIIGIAGWLALLIEAAVTRRWRTREFFFVLATPLLLGVILDWSVISSPFNLAFSLAANARVRLLLCFVVAVQAAAATDLAERGRRRPLLIGVAVVACALLILMRTTAFPNAAKRDLTLLAMLPSVVALGTVTWAAVSRRSAAFASMLAITATVVELWGFGRGWNPVVSDSKMYPTTPLLREVDRLRSVAREPFRIVGLGGMLFPNTSAMFSLDDVRAHDPMANGRYLGVLRVVTGYESEAYFAHWRNLDTRFLDFLNVRYVLAYPRTDLKDKQRYNLIYRGKDGWIFENRDVLPRFFAARNVLLEFKGDYFAHRLETENDWAHTGVVKALPVESDRMRQDLLAPRPLNAPEATVSIVNAAPTDFRMRVHAPRWTLIVSSQPIWPGWHIRMDGRFLDPLPVNGAFLGFTIPPGDHDVRVFYLPASFYGGLAVSLITIAAMIVISIRSKPRRVAFDDGIRE